MQTRTLGTNGVQVSALGFGGMGISFGCGRAVDRRDGLAVRAAVDAPAWPTWRSQPRIGTIGTAVASLHVQGARYPEHLQKMVGR